MKFFKSGLGNWYNDLTLIKEAVFEADKLGFDGALIPDHYMWGTRVWGKRPDDYVTLESWITLTYLAAKTDQIRLGTLVTPIPFRPPGILAKMISTLDLLSDGRVVVGVGAGWSREEFEGYSEWNEPKVRVDKTEEGLELMIKLWTEENVTHNGEYYFSRGAVLEPKPVQKPYPPLLFGGRGNRMLKLAGRLGDICFLMTQTTEEYRIGKKEVMESAKKFNRTDKIAFMAGSMGSRGSYDLKRYSERVDAAVELGASFFLTSFPRTDTFIESMRRFSKDVMPSYR